MTLMMKLMWKKFHSNMVRILVPGIKKPKLVEYIESSSEPGIFYKVTVMNDDSIHCQCPSFKACKHIEIIKKKYKIND